MPFAAIALLCILAIEEVPLRTTVDRDDQPVATLVDEQHEVVEGRGVGRLRAAADASDAAPVRDHRPPAGEDGPR